MIKYECIIVCVVAAIVADLVLAEDDIADTMTEDVLQPLTPEREDPHPITEKLASLMDDFLVTADLINRRPPDGTQPIVESVQLYKKMAESLEDIIDVLEDPDNAQYFLTAHGFDTIVAPNLQLKYGPLRSRLLLLTKTLFDIAPASTKAVIPTRILTDVLDIFENDDNVSLKGKAIQVLSVWLPNNPSAQARVMKLKGLEPFYEQFSKLDKSMIGEVLDLFGRIVREHEEARAKLKKSKVDLVSQKLYQQIGLIERLSTPTVCHGLYNVFMELWAASTLDQVVLLPVIDLMRLIKPYCTAVYRGDDHVKALLTKMLYFVENPNHKQYLESLNLSRPDLTAFFQDFINEITLLPKDEL